MAGADTMPPHGRVLRVLKHPAIKIVIPLLIAVIAVFILHELASHVKWADVKADLAAASPVALLKALGFTALSFAGISLYDALAVRSVAPGKVPFRIAALAGAAGYAISGLLGVSYLTGTAVRYRIYAAFGLDLTSVAGIIAVAWSGLLSGLALVFGALLTFHPRGLSAVLPIPPVVDTGIGLTFLAAFLGYLLWLATGQRHLKAGGFAIALPGVRPGTALAGAGLLDLTGAAMTLYVLMPSDAAQTLPYFFTIYFAAVGLGILSHSPGGLGVFEATIIAGLGASGRSDVLAALLLYRVIYTILPFVIAAAGLGVIMGMARRGELTGGAQMIWRAFHPLVPPVAAGIALLAGVLLLVSGNLPAEQSHLGVLRELLPLSFVEASHLTGSIAGLKTILDFIHPGETMVVTRIDRLARSLSDLQTIVSRLKEKGAHLAATEQPVDTSTAAGKAFFDMLGVFAEFETNLRRERQAEGIVAAKRRGVYRGRTPKIDMDAIVAKLAEGCSPTEIAREMGVSRGTVYKAKARMSSRGDITEPETS